MIQSLNSIKEESDAASLWIRKLVGQGIQPHEMAVFVRTTDQMQRAIGVIEKSDQRFSVLDEKLAIEFGRISICTMHLAKGLEFRAVVVMACDDDIIPLQERIESVSDESDLEDVYNTERQLLYVACTRARDHLLVTGVSPVSEFIDDLVER